jgi:hypothetical protein
VFSLQPLEIYADLTRGAGAKNVRARAEFKLREDLTVALEDERDGRRKRWVFRFEGLRHG